MNNNKKDIIIFGIGELAQLASFYFSNDSNYNVCAFTLDSQYVEMDSYLDLPLITFDKIQIAYPPDKYDMFVAIGYSKLNENRKTKYFEAKEKGYKLVSYISSKSTSWKGLDVGENTFIMEDNTIMPYCKIGNNVLIWVNNIIAHHMIIEDHVTITSHCAIGGNVIIREQAFIGLNSSLRNNIVIGKCAVIGTAANVTKDVNEFTTMLGNPAKASSIDSRKVNL